MPLLSPVRALVVASAAACLLAACSAVPPATPATAMPADTARTALDWAGTYRGTLPCADCAGIETTVVLDADGRYRSQMRYLGRPAAPFTESGRFAWNAAGNTVILQGREPTRYRVEGNRLVRLMADGGRVQGPLASRFVLQKLADGH